VGEGSGDGKIDGDEGRGSRDRGGSGTDGGTLMDFSSLRTQVIELLQREQRLSYRALKRQFALDDEDLEALKDELIYAKRLAVDEDGRVLVWTGGMSGAPPIASPVPLPATSDVSPAQVGAAPIVPPTPEAERRQLTV